MTDQVKLPLSAALNASLDMLRLRGDVTDAVVILINHHTNECKLGSLRGDNNHQYEILSRCMTAMQNARAQRSGILTVN